ncbi:MAG: CBS domain-containing protein [bacterium]
MGEKAVSGEFLAEQIRAFEQHLLTDIRALEYMLELDIFERDVRRIGAEQELFIVDADYQPAPIAMELLKRLDDPHFTTEIARYNLEFNLDPIMLHEHCLSELKGNVDAFLSKVRETATSLGKEVLLVGILPTLRKSHLGLENMSPLPRYYALNDAMTRLRGGDYELFIRGTDEIYIKHPTVMLESCNTSFQFHLQVSPDEFAKFYNIAQVISAPILSAAVNSPLLFGNRLWRETRIAVFQQSIDTRRVPPHLRHTVPRVSFGNDWVKESVLEIFQEDIMRFRVLLGAEIDEDPFELLEAGKAPKLKALQIHNSTIYRWNRPCYGLTNGKPHLRIENRILPSGPTVEDEIANAAFWLGLMIGMAANFDDITKHIKFDVAKTNFLFASRRGLHAQFHWPKKKTTPAQKLITQQLLPLAKAGLQEYHVDSNEIEHYLGIIENRVKTGNTGATWQIRSFEDSQFEGSVDERLCGLTASMLEKQKQSSPVHTWKPADIRLNGDWKKHYQRVEQFMSTDLITANKDDTVDLVLSMMKWRRVRHIPVEDNNNKLVGLITYRSLIRYLHNYADQKKNTPVPIKAIMKKNITTVTPDTTSVAAIEKIRKEGVSCLPVVDDEKLVGIVTEHDFLKIAAQFLEAEFLKK